MGNREGLVIRLRAGGCDYRRLWLAGWPWPWDNQSRWIMPWDVRTQREGLDCGLWMAWFT